jgi:hypothetical protein
MPDAGPGTWTRPFPRFRRRRASSLVQAAQTPPKTGLVKSWMPRGCGCCSISSANGRRRNTNPRGTASLSSAISGCTHCSRGQHRGRHHRGRQVAGSSGGSLRVAQRGSGQRLRALCNVQVSMTRADSFMQSCTIRRFRATPMPAVPERPGAQIVPFGTATNAIWVSELTPVWPGSGCDRDRRAGGLAARPRRPAAPACAALLPGGVVVRRVQATEARRVPTSTLDSSRLPYRSRSARQASSFSGCICCPSYRSCT